MTDSLKIALVSAGVPVRDIVCRTHPDDISARRVLVELLGTGKRRGIESVFSLHGFIKNPQEEMGKLSRSILGKYSTMKL